MNTIVLSCIFGGVWLISAIFFVVIYKKKPFGSGVDKNEVKIMIQNQKEQSEMLTKMMMQQLQDNQKNVQDTMNNMTVVQKLELESVSKRVNDLSERNEQRLEKLTNDVNTSLTNMRQENDKAIEKMRETVDEKLNNSLSQRLNESFSKIQQSLESVNCGIGEMRSLANGVGDLKKVLSNVKVRGGWGEVMLSAILEQTLASNQYSAQVMVKPNSKERVDFVVNMPGKDGHDVYLPIDSKFPMEDYNRLVEASETADKELFDKAKDQLIKRIKEEAKSIKEKYINVPETTDFAVMFLPNEGLYAEVVKHGGLIEDLQSKFKVVICGPTTITALLNSLQLGFKTLYIEKRSSELWQVILEFKKEIETYIGLLQKTQSKLNEANSTIELASKSTMKLKKKLDNVDIDDGDNQGELPSAE